MHPQLVPQLTPLIRAGRRSRPTGLPAGTPVVTTEGELPVEYLSPGDRIVTRNGAVPLRGISTLEALEVDVVIFAPASTERRRTALILPASQPVLVRDWRATILHGEAQILTPASSLVDDRLVRRERRARLRLIRLHFDAPQVLKAGGIEVASARTQAPALAFRWLH